jgi:hypothetical protein
MSDSDDTFRVQARFNKVEYADIQEDLDRYGQGAARAGRVRLLMRLGLAAARGLTHSDHQPQLAKVVDIPRSARSKETPTAVSPAPTIPSVSPLVAAPEPVPVHDSLEALEALGMDPTLFRFGQP